MASVSISGWANSWTSAGDRTFTLNVWEDSYDSVANTSKVVWQLVITGGNNQSMDTYVKCVVNGSSVYNKSLPATSDGGNTWNGFPANNGSTADSVTVSHGSDGKKTISFSIEGYAVVYSPKSKDGELTLTNIDRAAPTVTQANISNIDVNSFTISATSNVNCDSWEYSLNNGSTWTVFSTTDGQSASTSVTGLATNTEYSVLIRARKTLNQVYGTSGAKTAKTLGASTITSVTDIILGNRPTVTWTPLDASFKYEIRIELRGNNLVCVYDSVEITPHTTSPYSYNYLYTGADWSQCLPNATEGVATATLYTYTSDGTLIGTAQETFNVTVPTSVVPTITSVTIEEGTHSGYNEFVKSLSTVKATVVTSGQYAATITNIMVKVGDISYPASLYTGIATSEILQTYGTITVLTTVTDSRGRTSTDSQTITVYDYWRPTAALDIAVNDTTVATTVAGSIAPVNNLNAKSLVITRKRISDDTTTTYTVSPLTSYDYSVTWTQTVADIGTESYEYTAAVTDTIQTVTVKRLTAIICISRLRGGTGVTLFQEATQAGFWVRNVQHDITAADYAALAAEIAKTYDNTATYAVGEWTENNGDVYQCNTAITTAENWTAAHWTAIASATMKVAYIFLNIAKNV